MTTQKYRLAIAAAVAAAGLAGCSSLLGLNKEPSLADDQPVIDAAIDQMVVDMSTIDMDTSACAGMNCGVFGCDTAAHACRPAKLWVFLSGGQFTASGFGGIDNTVRPTADGKCFMTASTDFPNRACSANRTHAILTVTSADSIAAMSANYSIPTTTEVHRIDDDVLVFNNWNDLTGLVMPRTTVVSATIAPTDADGIVWTGTTTSNCSGWTTNVSGVSGVIGHTSGTAGGQTNWLATGSVPCNTGPLQHLLCVCWSGGN